MENINHYNHSNDLLNENEKNNAQINHIYSTDQNEIREQNPVPPAYESINIKINSDSNNHYDNNLPPLLTPLITNQVGDPTGINCCTHLNLELIFSTDCCGTCTCITCLILGVVGLVLCLAALAKLQDKKGSKSHHHHYHPTTVIVWRDHWLYDYGYDREFIEPRMNCHSNQVKPEDACGMNYPTKYKIQCRDCKEVLKKGYNPGSLSGAIIFGVIGIILGVIGIIYLVSS